MIGSRLSFAAVACTAVLAPAVATASNGTHPRTPVIWEDVPCMTVHDRSESPIFHLPYAIPHEDLEIGPDEVADSRRHQFFAFCRPHDALNFLPSWITQADADAALAIPDLVTAGEILPEDILELVPSWSDCWFRINADDERRPISFEMAEAGVDWDLATVAPGVYTLQGYTYEPEFNVWYTRPGVVKIHDGDIDAVGPAAAITTGAVTPYRDQEVMIEGCIDATAGSTYTAYWAASPPEGEEIEWTAYLEEEVVGPDFAFGFTPPEPMWGQAGMLRVDVADPQGRTYTAHQIALMVVIDQDDPEGCSEGSGFIGSPGCADDSTGADSATSGGTGGESTGSASSTDETTASGTTAPLQTSDDGGGGETCACTSDTRPGALASLLLLLPLARRRRRD